MQQSPVAVLVYSVINGTAHYETRSESLNDCGDKIKDLIRNLRREVVEGKASGITVDLAGFNRRYDDISTDAENHTRVDFMLATLEMSGDYKYTGILRLYMYLRAAFLYAVPYILPTLLLVGEGIFISDMLDITKVFTPYLLPVAQS